MLSTGSIAPDFELYSTPDQKLKLTELRNRKVILAFYPADWSPVCDDQMTLTTTPEPLTIGTLRSLYRCLRSYRQPTYPYAQNLFRKRISKLKLFVLALSVRVDACSY